jgi:ribosome maturation factor RimP
LRAQSEIETRILAMIEPTAAAQGLDIVRVRVMGRDKPILQIMLERPDGTMDVAACAKFSRAISPILETEDPIDGEYALEVSSPGIDRPLTRPGDFGKWAGHEIKVEIAIPVEGRRRYHGVIRGEADGVVSLDLKDGGAADIAVSGMTKAQLVLTNKLVAQAQAKGQIPDEETDEDFDDVEVTEDEADLGDEDAGDEDFEDADEAEASSEDNN